MKKEKTSKLLIIIGLVCLLIAIVITLLGYSNSILFVIGIYILLIGIIVLRSKEQHLKFLSVLVTAVAVVAFTCWASYGEIFLVRNVIAVGLSIFIYYCAVFSEIAKKLSLFSLVLVIISCCYFISSYLTYCNYAAIVLNIVLILIGFAKWVKGRENSSCET